MSRKLDIDTLSKNVLLNKKQRFMSGVTFLYAYNFKSVHAYLCAVPYFLHKSLIRHEIHPTQG